MILDRQVVCFQSVRAWLSLSVVPIQYVVHWPLQVVNDIESLISTHDSLVRENLQLKSEQLLLHADLQRLIAIESENNYLKSLIPSSQSIQRKTLVGELLAINGEPYVRRVVLNKGTRDGVYIGQPVLDATGVMGQVVQANWNTSVLMMINDQKSGIAVQNARNGLRAIAVGDSYLGKLHLMSIAKTTDVRQGDLFVTSGLSGSYPSGYPVGVVFSVVRDPTQPFLDVTLHPSAHLDSSRQFLLVGRASHAS